MVQAYESNNTSNYNLYKKEVSEWIYGLQNCNLYTTSDIKDPYNLSKKATTAGTSKDYVVSESVCKNTNCPELTVSYDDKTYGGKNNLGKVVIESISSLPLSSMVKWNISQIVLWKLILETLIQIH